MTADMAVDWERCETVHHYYRYSSEGIKVERLSVLHRVRSTQLLSVHCR